MKRLSISVECPRCGHEYEPSTASIRAGTWRRCPVCDPTPRGERKEHA